MFQFPRFASYTYVFSAWYRRSGGFPHSEIHGSKLIRSSPWLIAAYHVLHRLCAPRHSPNALWLLDRSHLQCLPGHQLVKRQPLYKHSNPIQLDIKLEKEFFNDFVFSYRKITRSQKWPSLILKKRPDYVIIYQDNPKTIPTNVPL